MSRSDSSASNEAAKSEPTPFPLYVTITTTIVDPVTNKQAVVDLTTEVFRHLPGDRGLPPMPPEGWPSLIPSCCDRCAAVAAAESDLRAYYGVLFGEIRD